MTLEAFGTWLAAIDPKATHYVAASSGPCTVWREYQRVGHHADGQHQGGWKVQIDRYTKDEADAIAAAIEVAIEVSVDIAAEHLVDYDTDTGMIRHIFDCEVA
jgi:hypothetical protein